MLEENKSVLDKPEILRREGMLTQTPKKGKRWVFNLVLILIVIGLTYYLFTHPQLIRDPFNKFFEDLLK